ncbi:hypothetical protein BKA67DRAFT_645752 [Truncatella angustata]|uniref:Uncharacterized protein n=1 Tax=Truncatella angustata TaxID=152316 RepID=A0A9P8UK25_9PEZI|nr:uncharacterized protein BKA67DRAFT_645752 [Truncatella angustata]KAH6653950.1 hypothetical protein BKA67DRAFT_645752 [Truncatella angustata]
MTTERVFCWLAGRVLVSVRTESFNRCHRQFLRFTGRNGAVMAFSSALLTANRTFRVCDPRNTPNSLRNSTAAIQTCYRQAPWRPNSRTALDLLVATFSSQRMRFSSLVESSMAQ